MSVKHILPWITLHTRKPRSSGVTSTIRYIQSVVITPTLIQYIQKQKLRMTLAHWKSEILSFSMDQCCLLDPAPIQSAHKERMSKTTAQWTTDTTHYNESLLLGSVLIEFMGRLRKITRWIHCSFQLPQIIPAEACLACPHRRPEEKDGSKGKQGLTVLSDQYWERCSDSVYTQGKAWGRPRHNGVSGPTTSVGSSWR